MSSEVFDIPRHGKAGVAFLGVELQDAWIVITSVFLGLAMGSKWGVGAYLGVPFAGYLLNKQYVDWRSNSLPGQLRARLFEVGWLGYSRAFTAQDVVFTGDEQVINPGSGQMINHAMALLSSDGAATATGRERST